jgi:hypothetical protein
VARDFSKNTTNYLTLGVNQIGPLISGASAISLLAKVRADAFGTGTADNAILAWGMTGNVTGGVFYVNGASPVVRVGGRSVSTDGFQSAVGTTALSTGVEYSIGGVLNIGGDRIRVYLDGTQEANTTVTFANATYTTSVGTAVENIGATFGSPPSATAGQWDGRISELTIFAGDIGSPEFADHHAGKSPLRVSVSAAPLVFYTQLLGNDSPEPALVSSIVGTITGSIPQGTHPTVYGYPSVFARRRRAA